MRETVTAAGIAQDYNRRNIQPDSVTEVKQGYLRLWIWCNSYVAELYIGGKDLRPGRVQIAGQAAYRNTTSPQDIADDLMLESRLTKPEIAMLSMSASTLGKIGGAAKTEAKQSASRANGKKGGRPRKSE